MGVDVGFEFYRYKNKKLEEANIIDSYRERCNFLNTRGRCDSTYLCKTRLFLMKDLENQKKKQKYNFVIKSKNNEKL